MNLGKNRMQTVPHVPWIALADIAWQIVILFLVASAFIITNSVSMELPSMTQQQEKERNEPVQVLVGADVLQIVEGNNTQNLTDRPTDPAEYAQLLPKLQELLAKRKGADRAVVITCKPNLPWQLQVNVMTDVTKAGGMPVIATEE